jgi:hypothetical protein
MTVLSRSTVFKFEIVNAMRASFPSVVPIAAFACASVVLQKGVSARTRPISRSGLPAGLGGAGGTDATGDGGAPGGVGAVACPKVTAKSSVPSAVENEGSI